MRKKLKHLLKPSWKKVILTIVLIVLLLGATFLLFRFFHSCFAYTGGFKSSKKRVPVEEVLKNRPYCRIVRGDNFFANSIEGFGWWVSENTVYFGLILIVFFFFPLFLFDNFDLSFLLIGLGIYFFWFSTLYILACCLVWIINTKSRNQIFRYLFLGLLVLVLAAGGLWFWWERTISTFCRSSADCVVKSGQCLHKNQEHSRLKVVRSWYDGEKCECVEGECKKITCENQGLFLYRDPEKGNRKCVKIPGAYEFTEAQIAYQKGGNIWVLDTVKQEKIQITENGLNKSPQWSPDGRYLAWITTKKLKEDDGMEKYGVNIKIMDYASREIEELLEPYDLGALNDPRKKMLLSLQSFDWSQDSKEIAYCRNGVWIKDLEINKERRVVDPYFDKDYLLGNELPEDYPEKRQYGQYNSCNFTPDSKKLILGKTIFLGYIQEILDLPTGNKTDISPLNPIGLTPEDVSPDSSKIAAGGTCGMTAGGVLYYDIDNNESSLIYPSESLGMKWINNNQVVVSKGLREEDEEFGYCGSEEFDIFIINLDGTIEKQLTSDGGRKYLIAISPDKKWAVYSVDQNLIAISLEDGRRVDLDITEISSDSWRPKIELPNTEAKLPDIDYCEAMGYEYQVGGNCIFPDGSKCSSWAFFRGKCGQEFSYCENQGYTIENRKDDMESWSAEYAVCVFDDGSECLEEKYMNNECGPSECSKWVMSKGGCVKSGDSK